MQEELQQRIVINPEVMAGKPVIKGTRIPVGMIVRLVAQGMTTEEILEEYPNLSAEDVQAALSYASELVESEDVFPLSA
jgi:uncharacterized protein (DUF433 family)